MIFSGPAPVRSRASVAACVGVVAAAIIAPAPAPKDTPKDTPKNSRRRSGIVLPEFIMLSLAFSTTFAEIPAARKIHRLTFHAADALFTPQGFFMPQGL